MCLEKRGKVWGLFLLGGNPKATSNRTESQYNASKFLISLWNSPNSYCIQLTFSKTEPKLAVTTKSLFKANCNVISSASFELGEQFGTLSHSFGVVGMTVFTSSTERSTNPDVLKARFTQTRIV